MGKEKVAAQQLHCRTPTNHSSGNTQGNTKITTSLFLTTKQRTVQGRFFFLPITVLLNRAFLSHSFHPFNICHKGWANVHKIPARTGWIQPLF